MVLNDKERKAVDKKFENPKLTVKCPRCGGLLEYKEFQTAAQVRCTTKGCVEVNIRGI